MSRSDQTPNSEPNIQIPHEHEHNHEHNDECGGGHVHEHKHEHNDECGCGHLHEHNDECGCGHLREHNDECGCGHVHQHEEASHPHTEKQIDGAISKVFILENLDCANCAAKMEAKINSLPDVSTATITYATKQLRIKARNYDSLIPEITRICNTIEDNIQVVEQKKREVPKKERRNLWSDHKSAIISIAIGASIFIFAEAVHKVTGSESFSLPLVIALLAAYIILGGKIVLTALKNLGKGQIFDENFLMSVATLGAIIIQNYPEAVGVMLFYRVGELFEEIAVERSRSQIMDAVDLRPEVVNRLENDNVHVIPAEDAVVGDLLLIRPGERIPLDGEVIDGESRIDTSAVTGEPVPLKVSPGAKLISGCVNTSGTLQMRVEKVLQESMVTKILDSVENAAASKPKIDKFITRFARIYTPIVVLLTLFTALGIPLITGQEFYPWIYTALTFLVMSCPCALVLSVPLAFFCGIGAGSKIGILFKGGVAIESLANIKAVVMDKTGTITEGNFVVQQVNPVSAANSGSVSTRENRSASDLLLSQCASCESTSTHPIGHSIVEAAKAKGLEIIRPDKVEEIAGKGIKAVINGKMFLCGNRKLMDQFHVDLSAYSSHGFGSEVLMAANGIYLGNITIADTIKEEAPAAIRRIKDQHIVTAMLTGDSQDSADAVAKATGVEEVHAKLLPQDKLSELQTIRQEHGSVMFVGDGINDAPVLAGSDVGAAMGSGADAAIEAADVVFMNSNMDAIPTAVAIAKKTTQIAKQNVTFALAIKIAVMILGLTGIYSNMWLAVFADTGVAFLCILNSIRVLRFK